MASHGLTLTRRGFLALSATLAAACKSGAGRGENREVVVFAAASLTDVFGSIADDFRQSHPDVPTKLSFAGSQSLRTQIENGASPQVVASANAAHMQALADANLIEAPQVFAHNELVIVVPPDNPAEVQSLADLPRAQRIVLAAESVPAGAYAERIFARAKDDLGADFPARVHAHVVSRENHVRQTLQKVVLGEADAAVVYATDARAAGDGVTTIAIPEAHNVRAAYPIAILRDTSHRRLASTFVDLVRSPRGATHLEAAGFRPV